MRHVLPLAVLLLLPILPPVHADPGGTDAGGDASTAITLGPGAYSGTLGSPSTDREDWYWLTHGAGEGAHVTVVAPRGAVRLLVYDSGTDALPRSTATSPFNATHMTLVATAAGEGGAVLVRLTYLGGPAAAYDMDVQTVAIADAHVAAVWVTEAPCEGCVEPQHPLRLLIHVEVLNDGLAAYDGRILVSAHGSTSDVIAIQGLTLWPGSHAVLTYDWRPVAAGTVSIRAEAARDPANWNNRGSTEHSVVVEGPGIVIGAVPV